jgi:glucose/mannose-6-phosphate isomerase
MDDLRQKFDTDNLYPVIVNLPNQILKAWDFTSAKFFQTPKQIIVCGMGGSALPANILKTFLVNSNSNFQLPIKICRDYNLPADFDDQSAGVFISYSGNTEETLSCFEQALKTGNKNLVAIATGGSLKELAEKNNVQFITIPTDVLQPRMGYGYFFGALIKLLVNSELLTLDFEEIKNDVAVLLEKNKNYEAQGQELAPQLLNKIPIIYTSDAWKFLAMIIKINFNENSKIQSFWNTFPEMNHNEMVGFTNLLAQYKVLIFKDPNDHERVQKRMQIFKQVLADKISTEIIEMPEGSTLVKIFSTLMIGLWTSYYLALTYGINPTPVDMVEEFKNLMKK